MEFLKRLFGGAFKSTGAATGDARAIFYYVRVRKCGAIARARIDRHNDLSLDDDGDGYVARKQVVDGVCYGMAEITLRFDAARKEISREVANGEFVTRDDWEQQERARSAIMPA